MGRLLAKNLPFQEILGQKYAESEQICFFWEESFHTPYDRISQGTIRKLPECALIEGLLGPHSLKDCQIDRRLGHKDVVI